MNLYEFEIQDYSLQAEYDYSEPDDTTGYVGGVTVHRVFIHAMEKDSSSYRTVDILPFLEKTGIACSEHISEEIEENVYDK